MLRDVPPPYQADVHHQSARSFVKGGLLGIMARLWCHHARAYDALEFKIGAPAVKRTQQ